MLERITSQNEYVLLRSKHAAKPKSRARAARIAGHIEGEHTSDRSTVPSAAATRNTTASAKKIA